MRRRKKKHKSPKELSKALYLFTIFNLLGGSIYGLYYGIFLYRHSFDIRVLIIDSLLVVASGWVGYLFGSHLIQNKGYLRAMKIAFFMLFVIAIMTVFLTGRIHSLYPILSLARGFPAGIYTSVIDIFLLKELTSKKRGKYFSLNLSIEFVVSVIIPILIGGMISLSTSYKLVFLLAGLIYFSALFLPVKFDRKPEGKIILTPKSSIFKKPGIKEFNINTALTNGADQLNCLLLAIVPFLIFGSEFKVGSFSSFIAILAAVVAFSTHKFKHKKLVKLGYFGNIGRLISNLVLCVSWTPFALFVQGIVSKAMSPLNDPIFQKTKLSSSTKILGQDLHKKALQMNFMNATMSTIGKAVALLTFLVFLAHNQQNQTGTLKGLLIVYALWKALNYIWILNMNTRLKGAPKNLHIAEELPEAA